MLSITVIIMFIFISFQLEKIKTEIFYVNFVIN